MCVCFCCYLKVVWAHITLLNLLMHLTLIKKCLATALHQKAMQIAAVWCAEVCLSPPFDVKLIALRLRHLRFSVRDSSLSALLPKTAAITYWTCTTLWVNMLPDRKWIISINQFRSCGETKQNLLSTVCYLWVHFLFSLFFLSSRSCFNTGTILLS